MTAKDIITILIPVLVALVSGLYAYLQTRKTASVEGQKLNLTSYESLNKSQAEEIERLREDRAEDRRFFDDQRRANHEEIEELRRRLIEITKKCDDQRERFDELVRWTRVVVRIFNDPGLVRILSASEVHIPPPPTWPDEI